MKATLTLDDGTIYKATVEIVDEPKKFKPGQMVEILDWEIFTNCYKPYGIIARYSEAVRDTLHVRLFFASGGLEAATLRFRAKSLR